jgi:hypothetical protein
MTMPSLTVEQFSLILCAMMTGSWVIGFIAGRIQGHFEMVENDPNVRGYWIQHDLLGRIVKQHVTREIYPGYTYDPPADKGEERT